MQELFDFYGAHEYAYEFLYWSNAAFFPGRIWMRRCPRRTGSPTCGSLGSSKVGEIVKIKIKRVTYWWLKTILKTLQFIFSLDYIPKTEEEDIVFTLAMVIIEIDHVFKTRPSILCVTQKRAFMPLYIVLGQHRACMPVYIGKSGHLVGWHRCLTDRQTTEYSATQLLSSIQFKLSHAIYKFLDSLQGNLHIWRSGRGENRLDSSFTTLLTVVTS